MQDYYSNQWLFSSVWPIWCPTILREITLRINVVPLFILCICEKNPPKNSSYSFSGLALQVLQVLYLLITQFSPNKQELDPIRDISTRTYPNTHTHTRSQPHTQSQPAAPWSIMQKSRGGKKRQKPIFSCAPKPSYTILWALCFLNSLCSSPVDRVCFFPVWPYRVLMRSSGEFLILLWI